MSEDLFLTRPKFTTKKYGSRKDPDKTKRPCIHCNKRRIKCDLTRPSCSKCSTKGLICYYERPIRIIQRQDREIVDNKIYSTNFNKSSSFFKKDGLGAVIPANDTSSNANGNQKPLGDIVYEFGKGDAHVFPNQALAAVQSNEKQPTVGKSDRTFRESFCHTLGFARKEEKSGCAAVVSCQAFDILALQTTSQSVATLLAEHVDVKMEDILDLFNYFVEIILDQMVPYDSYQSPYRKFLLAKVQKSTALLTTVASISAGHLYERDLISRKVAVAVNELSTIFANQSYGNLKEQIENGHDFVNDAKVLDNCLNLLLQFSRSIFCCGTSRIARFSSLRGYIAIVNTIFMDLRQKSAFEFEKLDLGQNGFLWFLLQRLIFNDIFFSILNNSKPLVNIELIRYASEFEQKCILKTNELSLSDNCSILSTSIEITGCPMSLLEIMHQIQTTSFMLQRLEEEVRRGSDDSLEISVIKKRAAYGKHFQEKSKCIYESYKQNLVSSRCIDENDVTGFASLLKIFFYTTNILNLKYIMKDNSSSLQMIISVHELLEVVSKEIDVGSGPDTCVAFPVFIAAREANLQSHRDAVLNFMDLSSWHLNLGGQKMAKELLCNFYWAGNREQVKRDLTESYLILY